VGEVRVLRCKLVTRFTRACALPLLDEVEAIIAPKHFVTDKKRWRSEYEAFNRVVGILTQASFARGVGHRHAVSFRESFDLKTGQISEGTTVVEEKFHFSQNF
jgi:hypothetical protein